MNSVSGSGTKNELWKSTNIYRITNIPTGRVAARIQTFQGTQQDAEGKDKVKQDIQTKPIGSNAPTKQSSPTDLDFDSSLHPYVEEDYAPTYRNLKSLGSMPSAPRNLSIDEKEVHLGSPTSKMYAERARALDLLDMGFVRDDIQPRVLSHRSPSTSRSRPRADAHPSEVLQDVRSRLHSIQQAVRDSRRDNIIGTEDMIDELGSMLDAAIATTVPEFNSDSVPMHDPNSRQTSRSRSPLKNTIATDRSFGRTAIVRNVETIKRERCEADNAYHCPDLRGPALAPVGHVLSSCRSETSAEQHVVQGESVALPTRSPQKLVEQHKSRPTLHAARRVTEPVPKLTEGTGFLLSSPVRERRLLFESLSREHTSEEDHAVSLQQPLAHRMGVTSSSILFQAPLHHEQLCAPDWSTHEQLIPLALPQLIDTERLRKRQASSGEQMNSGGSTENAPFQPEPKHDRQARETPHIPDRQSSVWLSHLRSSPHRSGSATVQESQYTATADPEHDEHYPKHRPSLVRNKIRGLLACSKFVNVEDTASQDESTGKMSTSPSKSMPKRDDEFENPDTEPSPKSQKHNTEVDEFPSNDGAWSDPRSPRHLRHAAEVLFNPGKSSVGSSPVKSMGSTPKRGRSRRIKHDFSPGSKHYNIRSRFTLSPSRSGSRGSKGSVSLNIRARMSPKRGVDGQDEAEFSIMADVGSDNSSQE